MYSSVADDTGSTVANVAESKLILREIEEGGCALACGILRTVPQFAGGMPPLTHGEASISVLAARPICGHMNSSTNAAPITSNGTRHPEHIEIVGVLREVKLFSATDVPTAQDAAR
jgi:hypothetical protein